MEVKYTKKNWDKKNNYVKSRMTENKIYKFLKVKSKIGQINLLRIKFIKN